MTATDLLIPDPATLFISHNPLDGPVPDNVGVRAKVIADSISPDGYRVTTVEATMHRFVLAEFNTHRVMSRNSASSRAIPVSKQLVKVRDWPAFPVEWPAEQPGMQGGDLLEGIDLEEAQRLFIELHEFTVNRINEYLDDVADRYPGLSPKELKFHTLHKSLINRLIEPYMWHTVAFTSTEWVGFFDQRCSPLAQPEIRVAAEAIRDVYDASTPNLLGYGEWHLPYIRSEDWDWARQIVSESRAPGYDRYDTAVEDDVLEALKRVSSARCARTSYLTHNGIRDPFDDIRLFNDLVSASPMHASPLEHPCTPVEPGTAQFGNLAGFHQLRQEIEAALFTDTLVVGDLVPAGAGS